MTVNVTVCGRTITKRWFVMTCPVCGISDSVILQSLAGSAYWGSIQRCTNCGDAWAEGELLGRPFRRGWRADAVRKAQVDMDEACQHDVRFDRDTFALLPCECSTEPQEKP